MSDDTSYGPAFDLGDDGWVRFANNALVTWSVFISLGLIVFEFTSNAFLGMVIVCLKFGLPDLLAAKWTFDDPYRARGSALRYFSIANAFYKIGLFGVMILFVIRVAWLIDRNNFMPMFISQAMIASLFVFFGMFIGYICAAKASSLVCQHRLKLWLDDEFYRSRRYRVFPPVYIGRRNHIRAIALLTVLLSVFFLLITTLGLYWSGTYLASAVRNADRGSIERGAAYIGALAVILACLVGLFSQQTRTLRTAARIPEECWVEWTGEG
ncbi:MAG: hypothetical protein WEB58_14075 [Planctomycetaceae bacterium]